MGLLLAAMTSAAGCRSETVPRDTPPAERTVVSLAPGITEMIFAMGQGHRLLGRGRYCTYPPEAQKLPVLGDAVNLNIEALLVARPDLIVLNTSKAETYERLTAAGIRCIAPPTETVDQVYQAIALLGRQLGAEAAAGRLAGRLRAELEQVRRTAAAAGKVRTLVTFPNVLGEGNQVRVVGRETFVTQLLTLAGGRNVVPSNGYPRVHFETILRWAPQVVIISAPGDIAPGMTDQQYREPWLGRKSLPAVKDGRVVVLRQAYLTIPGPRMGEAARLLLGTLHPDLAAGAGATQGKKGEQPSP
ncbi:MAG: ABC transporter substrate-binding protein [Anaerolineaceae bacterium]|nr:ABC transporter substrate-binding protein [Anaerolineaceae bacterium]